MYFDELTKVVYLDNFVFSPLTNSILGGVHRYNLFLQNINPNFSDTDWYSFYTQSHNITGKFLLRLHYKAVNFGYKIDGYDSIEAELRFGSSTVYIREDSEGWIEELYSNSDTFYIAIQNKSWSIPIDAYIEIDYLELLPYFSDISWSEYQFTDPASFTESKNINSKSKLYGSLTDPELLPLYTIDGSLPTLNNTSLTHSLSYENYADRIVSSSTMITDTYTVNHSLLYIKSFFDRLTGFVPSYQESYLCKYGKDQKSYFLTLNSIYDDFKLGALRLGWRSDNEYSKGWQFTENGLKTPRIVDGSCYIYSSAWDYEAVYGTSKIVVEYEVYSPMSFSGSCEIRLTYDNGSYVYAHWIDQTNGTFIAEFSADTMGTTLPYSGIIHIVYNSYAYMGGSPDQYVLIKRIDFVDSHKPNIGELELVPGTELFPNGQPSLAWNFTGNWQSYPELDYKLNDFVLVSPELILSGTFTAFSIPIETTGGQLSINMVLASGNSCLVKLNGLNSRSIIEFNSRRIPFTYSYTLEPGQYDLYIIHARFPWYGYDDEDLTHRLYVIELSYPTNDGIKLFNYATKQDYQITSYSGSVVAAEGYVFNDISTYANWDWQLASSFLTSADAQVNGFGASIVGTESKSMSITIPISQTNDEMSFYDTCFTKSIVTSYGVYNYNYNYYSDYHKLIIKTSWGGSYQDYLYYGSYDYVSLDWGTYVSSKFPYDSLGESYSTDVPSNAPETGTITFSLVSENTTFPVEHYFTKIQLPVPTEPISIELVPTEDIVVFPINVEFTHPISLEVWYTTDDSNPKLSETAKLYTAPFSLTESKLIRYSFKPVGASYWLAGEFSKIYSDTVIEKFKICHDIVQIGMIKYLKLYSIPWHIPIILISSDENGIVYSVYSQLIELAAGTNSFIYTTPIVSYIQSYQYPASFINSIDIFSTSLLQIENGAVSIDGNLYHSQYSLTKELSVFTPSIIPSIMPGIYYNSINISLRCNIDQYDIFMLVGNNWVVVNNIVVSATETLHLMLDNGIDKIYQDLDYIVLSDSDMYAYYAKINRSLFSLDSSFAKISQTNRPYSDEKSIVITSINYTSISDLSSLAYTDYSTYVVTNNVLSLFADPELTKPFSLHFKLNVSPDQYIMLPDEYTTIYKDGNRFRNISVSSLACKIGTNVASNSEILLVPDMAIRLCVDNSLKTAIVMQVWTNIPIGNYLISSSSSVKLSNDGNNFNQVIKLESETLFIIADSGIDTQNSIEADISIDMISCEIYNARN